MPGDVAAAVSKPCVIGLAGCGKMGGAMVRAWLSSGIVSHIYILDPGGLSPDLLARPEITYCAGDSIFLSHAARWDLMVVALKPQGIDEFCLSMKTHFPPETGILSIAAGRTIASFTRHFGSRQPVIRSMPNTPAAIGRGMTVAVAAPNAPASFVANADALLSALGMVEWVSDETLLDAVTAVSGSGPAYLFYLIEAMAEAGVKAGLDPAFALTLARQTVIGAAALAESEADLPPAILRENVTSPNGTTAAALSVLMDGRFQSLMDDAIKKAADKSRALSS